MQVKERVRKEEEAAASAENVEQLKKTLQEVEIKGTGTTHIFLNVDIISGSIADPRCLSRIRFKEFKYFNPKNCF
jgi:hypothetical protein